MWAESGRRRREDGDGGCVWSSKRKNIFIKNNIAAAEEFFIVKVIKTIRLLPKRIANEDAFASSWIKFIGRLKVSGVT